MSKSYIYKDQSKIYNSLAWQMFGKRRCELNEEELRMYNRKMKETSRKNDPENKQKERDYYKEYRKNHKERMLEYGKKYRAEHPYKSQRKENPYKDSISRNLFGCRVVDMTPEQKREYNRIRCREYQNKVRKAKRER